MCKVSALGSSLLLAFWGTIELMKLLPVELVFSFLFRDRHGHRSNRTIFSPAPGNAYFVFLSTSKPLCSRACSRHSIPRKSDKSSAFFFAQSAGQFFECLSVSFDGHTLRRSSRSPPLRRASNQIVAWSARNKIILVVLAATKK
jgi:hypothetical protein